MQAKLDRPGSGIEQTALDHSLAPPYPSSPGWNIELDGAGQFVEVAGANRCTACTRSSRGRVVAAACMTSLNSLASRSRFLLLRHRQCSCSLRQQDGCVLLCSRLGAAERHDEARGRVSSRDHPSETRSAPRAPFGRQRRSRPQFRAWHEGCGAARKKTAGGATTPAFVEEVVQFRHGRHSLHCVAVERRRLIESSFGIAMEGACIWVYAQVVDPAGAGGGTVFGLARRLIEFAPA